MLARSATDLGLLDLPLPLTFFFRALRAAAIALAIPPPAPASGPADDVPPAPLEAGSVPGTIAALRSLFSASLTFRRPPPPLPPAARIEDKRSSRPAGVLDVGGIDGAEGGGGAGGGASAEDG